MRRKAVFLVLVLCPLSTGCSGLFNIGARNLLYEARLQRDSRLERYYFGYLAHQAWADVRARCPQQKYSFDYACGFKAGFVDYLYAGGNGEPPAFLPKRYLTFHEQRKRGSQGLQDWYAGFRHGAAVAHESGIREARLITLPPPPGPLLPPTDAFVPGPIAEENKPVEKAPLLAMPKSQITEGSRQKPRSPDLPSIEDEKADAPRSYLPDSERQP